MTIRINKVYTRSGDDGTTGLVGGSRVLKSDKRVSVFGGIDEINSLLGLVKEAIGEATLALRPVIEELQQQLFDLGSELATPNEASYEQMFKVSQSEVQYLEQLCDKYLEGQEGLRSFILPGGNELAARLHIARCATRRIERDIVSLFESESSRGNCANQNILAYINRLSDFLFVAARWALSQEGKTVPLWAKDRSRK